MISARTIASVIVVVLQYLNIIVIYTYNIMESSASNGLLVVL